MVFVPIRVYLSDPWSSIQLIGKGRLNDQAAFMRDVRCLM